MLLRVFLFLSVIFFSSSLFANSASPIWTFESPDAITAIDTIGDCSDPSIKNGGMDLLAGTSFDTLFLIEARKGSGQNIQGAPLWNYNFRSTVQSIKSTPDMNYDGRPDVVAGNQEGAIALLSGGNGHIFWVYIANSATILSLAYIPDINGDGVSEIIAGADNDSIYCFSGFLTDMWKPDAQTMQAEVLWKFNTKRGGQQGLGLKKTLISNKRPGTDISGVNSIAVLYDNSTCYGIVAGTSSNTIYCISPAATNGIPSEKWKYTTAGDVWDVKTVNDLNNDKISDIVAACGDDKCYMLSGKDGTLLWSRSVNNGATVVSVIGDVNGDKEPDILLGDGEGKVHCISGKSSGNVTQDIWTFNTNDSATITAINRLPDVDNDGKDECIFGTSNDTVYVISGTGEKLWNSYMLGIVSAVSPISDVDGDGIDDVAAASLGGICTVFKGQGGSEVKISQQVNSGSPKPSITITDDKISFTTSTNEVSRVSVSIYNFKGQCIKSWHNILSKGNYTLKQNLTTGSYIITLKHNGNELLKKSFVIF
jgi:hypothetical protein